MFVELHIIQNFAPSNLNRDDTGQPKDCLFGGARRARISSQCLKRAMRSAPSFAASTAVASGVRTKRLLDAVSARLPQESVAAALPVATLIVEKLYTKFDGKDTGKTAVLVYLSEREIGEIAAEAARIVAAESDEKARSTAVDAFVRKMVQSLRSRTSAPDIALFGRMLAESPELNIDAACQVAHAISTHRISMEMDFYTAVDDLRREDTAGADMMGFTGFDSACYYRYARLDWEQLLANLGGDAELALRTVRGFVEAAIDAVPTGKQNSSAAYNPPAAVLAVVRHKGMAWSLANAFEKPVRAGEDGYVRPSARELARYFERISAVYGAETVAATAVLSGEEELELGTLQAAVAPTRKDFVTAIMDGARTATIAGAEAGA